MKVLFAFALLLIGPVRAFEGCPCVQDYVKFYFDLKYGCPKNGIDNPKDFSSTTCNVYDRLTTVNKVVLHDHQMDGANMTLQVLREEEPSLNANRTYFEYLRQHDAPSMLLMDFYSRSNALLASVDLFYDLNNHDCVLANSPIFWPKDKVYFLDVDFIRETADPHCFFPRDGGVMTEDH